MYGIQRRVGAWKESGMGRKVEGGVGEEGDGIGYYEQEKS
jgi:hypothetical protein